MIVSDKVNHMTGIWNPGDVMTPGEYKPLQCEWLRKLEIIEKEAEFLKNHLHNRGPCWTMKVDEDPTERLNRIIRAVEELRKQP